MRPIDLQHLMERVTEDVVGVISPTGNSDSGEYIGTPSIISDENNTVGDINMSNLAISRNENSNSCQSIDAGEIRSGSAGIVLGSDGAVTIHSQGKDVLKIDHDEIIINGDCRISLDAIKVSADCINNNFAPGEFMDIVKEIMRIKSSKEVIDKRLGAIDD